VEASVPESDKAKFRGDFQLQGHMMRGHGGGFFLFVDSPPRDAGNSGEQKGKQA
jgi:hypothetical protein